MDRIDEGENKLYLRRICVLRRCYSTGCFDELFPLLSENVKLTSRWVWEPNEGKQAVVDYFTGKGATLRKNNCCPHCNIITFHGNGRTINNACFETAEGFMVTCDLESWYPDGQYAMIMCQNPEYTKDAVVVDIELDNKGLFSYIALDMPELYDFTMVDDDRLEILPSDDEIRARISALLESDPEDLGEIRAYIDQHRYIYKGNLWEFAFRTAVQKGAFHYVEDSSYTVLLNDCDGYCSYIYETEDEDMQQLLMDLGGYKSTDDYDVCRFSYESVNNEILEFDPDFQEEVFNKYLEVKGLTREDIVLALKKLSDDNEDDDCPDGDDFDWDNEDVDLEYDLQALGVELDEETGELCLCGPESYMGVETGDLIESLGWDLEFDGTRCGMEFTGIYYVK